MNVPLFRAVSNYNIYSVICTIYIIFMSINQTICSAFVLLNNLIRKERSYDQT